MALDAWYQKEFDKCAYEIKLAEKDYKVHLPASNPFSSPLPKKPPLTPPSAPSIPGKNSSNLGTSSALRNPSNPPPLSPIPTNLDPAQHPPVHPINSTMVLILMCMHLHLVPLKILMWEVQDCINRIRLLLRLGIGRRGVGMRVWI